jgi:periplasmic protein TonB
LKVGDVGNSLRSRFDQIKPASYRIAEISAWTGQAQASSASSSKASAKSSAPKADIDTSIAPITPAITLPPLVSSETESSSSKAAVKTAVASSKAPTPIEDDEDDAPAFTTESLLARQFYVKELIKAINQKVRYPVSAAQKGQEGSVRVRVVLDRQGNIMVIEPIESSPYAALNREAVAGQSFEFNAPIRFTLLQKPKK